MLEASAYVLRRADHAITDRAELERLLNAALVGRIGVIAQGEPYIVPLNFAYDTGRIILHTASQGRLISALQASPRVCFEVDEFVATLPNPVLCDYDTAYESVICFGEAGILEALETRTEALRLLARKYATPEKAAALQPRTVEAYRGKLGAHTAVIEIRIETMTGKRQLPLP